MDAGGRSQLADDGAQSRRVCGLIGSGCGLAPDVPVRASGWGTCRHHRSASASDWDPGSGHRVGRSVRTRGLAVMGYGRHPAWLYVSFSRCCCAHHAGMASDRSATRSAATSQVRRCPQQHRPQCQSCDRTGACGRHHRSMGPGCAILDQCAEHRRGYCRPHLVAPAGGRRRAAPPAGAVSSRHRCRPAACPL